jgi:hypothetical protein
MRACGWKFGLLAFMLASVVACSRDPNAEANKLFVEAQQLMAEGDDGAGT